MWRILLIGLGAYSGYRLAKMGESRYNFILATATAALVYKLTQARMKSTGEVAENGKKYIDVEAEVVES
jgi:hypothetical protein